MKKVLVFIVLIAGVPAIAIAQVHQDWGSRSGDPGTLKWRYLTGSAVQTSPAIGSDGTVYIGSADGYLYAIHGSGPLANTPWPMFHHDLKHTGNITSADVGTVRIDQPTSAKVGQTVQPMATFKNFGPNSANFDVYCEIGSYLSHKSVENLARDHIIKITCDDWTPATAGSVTIIAYTKLNGDVIPVNDTAARTIIVTGIQEVTVKKPLEFKVRPVLSRGMINVSSPNPIWIYDVRGSVIGKGEAGDKKFLLKSAGVYFVKSGDAVKKIIRVD